jgi:hypothetical protein
MDSEETGQSQDSKGHWKCCGQDESPIVPPKAWRMLIVELQCHIILKRFPFTPRTTQTLSIQVHTFQQSHSRIVFRIGRLLQSSFKDQKKFTRRQLINQSDIWLDRVITTRESMPRHVPPGKKYRKTKTSVDGTYTDWGWDRICDKTYVTAIWALSQNKRVSHKLPQSSVNGIDPRG